MTPEMSPAAQLIFGIGVLIVCGIWFIFQRFIEKSSDGEMGFSLFPLLIGILALWLALSGAAALIHGDTTKSVTAVFNLRLQNW